MGVLCTVQVICIVSMHLSVKYPGAWGSSPLLRDTVQDLSLSESASAFSNPVCHVLGVLLLRLRLPIQMACSLIGCPDILYEYSVVLLGSLVVGVG